MDNNSVYLNGTVKRDPKRYEVGDSVTLEFPISVWCESAQRNDVYDCKIISGTEAYDDCQGILRHGDEIEIVGHLQKSTETKTGNCGRMHVSIDVTEVIIFVEYFQSIYGTETEENSES